MGPAGARRGDAVVAEGSRGAVDEVDGGDDPCDVILSRLTLDGPDTATLLFPRTT